MGPVTRSHTAAGPKLARTLQSSMPWLREPKHRAQAWLRRVRRTPHEPDFDVLARVELLDDACLVDVGANRGQSIESFRLHLPTARIEAFEPQQELAEALQQRYRHHPRVRIHPFGLGAELSTTRLFVPVYRGYRYDGLASTVETEAAGWISADTVYGFDPRRLRIETTDIRTVPMDDHELTPAVIKIDVQGTEADVLEGGRRTISEHGPLVIMEGGAHTLPAWMVELGYSVRWWTGTRLTRTPREQPNVLALPPVERRRTWRLHSPLNG